MHSVLAFIATYYYFFAHALVTLAVLAILWWRTPALYRRMRTQLVLINLIAFVVFWRYPLAPPRMLAGLGFQDIVASTHAVISWHSAALDARRRPVRGDALAAHRLGVVVGARDLAADAAGARCARSRSCTRCSRRSSCSRPATTSCSTCSPAP